MPAVAIYLALAGLAFAVDANGSLLSGPSFLGLGNVQGLVTSVALGLVLAVITLWFTRVALRKSSQLRALHADLRPFTHGAGDAGLFAMACASGIAEELFFRGALVPLVGVGVSSALFGVLHQIRGRGRIVWMLWAALMGLAFAMLFVLTGHLLGAIVAHVLVNFENLRVLRDHEPESRPRSLGGLLRKP